MSTFTVQATLSHPERRERSVTLDLVVGTRATYTVLPAEVVELLALPTPYTPYERPVELATGEHAVYPLGLVRLAPESPPIQSTEGSFPFRTSSS